LASEDADGRTCFSGKRVSFASPETSRNEEYCFSGGGKKCVKHIDRSRGVGFCGLMCLQLFRAVGVCIVPDPPNTPHSRPHTAPFGDPKGTTWCDQAGSPDGTTPGSRATPHTVDEDQSCVQQGGIPPKKSQKWPWGRERPAEEASGGNV